MINSYNSEKFDTEIKMTARTTELLHAIEWRYRSPAPEKKHVWRGECVEQEVGKTYGISITKCKII